MPIYEFKCTNCDSEFESIVLSRNDEICCPDCENTKVERLMSACSFKTGGGSYTAPSSPSSGGCSGCSSTNCSTCH